MSIFDGLKILEEKESKFNGKVTVIKSLAWGTYIQVDGLTQSGGVVSDVWKRTLKYINIKEENPKKVLILGLGGGSVALLVRKIWPNSEITGVDIDPVIVELGSRHLGLGKSGVNAVIHDAMKFVRQEVKSKKKYDLVIIDMYKGHDVPEKFTQDVFLKIIKKLLNKNGIAIFNRLYFGEKRKIAMKFGEKLQKVFNKVDYFFPEANLMLICNI